MWARCCSTPERASEAGAAILADALSYLDCQVVAKATSPAPSRGTGCATRLAMKAGESPRRRRGHVTSAHQDVPQRSGYAIVGTGPEVVDVVNGRPVPAEPPLRAVVVKGEVAQPVGSVAQATVPISRRARLAGMRHVSMPASASRIRPGRKNGRES